MSCQSCKLAPIETEVVSDEGHKPFRVCQACAHRLETRSLRPLEWYNLATLYGPFPFLLHDDFYDDDGTACQSDEAVVDAELFPAPTLEQVAHDLEQLLDYAMTRWLVDDNAARAISQHNNESVLLSLHRRIAEYPGFETKSFAYDICALSLGRSAEDWIRAEWKSFDPELLHSLAPATAVCLPFEEGFNLMAQAISQVSIKERAQASGTLAWFHSERTLDWIEQNLCGPLTDSWGRLAAVSELNWERVAKWLASGRPLSLVALDALNACWHYNTIILRRFAPKLLKPIPVDDMTAALIAYHLNDPVPRVRNTIDTIVSHWDDICES